MGEVRFMFVRYEDAKVRKTGFEGVTFRTLATGERIMLTVMHYEEGAVVSPHSHPNEQVGYVIRGKLRVRIGREEAILSEGDSYAVPAGETHSMVALEETYVVDTFSPPREDYIERR